MTGTDESEVMSGAVSALPDADTLDAIRVRLDAVAPEPWTALGTGVRNGDHWHVIADGEAILHVASNDGSNEDQRQPLAEFVAHAPADIRVLLAEVDWMTAELDRRIEDVIDEGIGLKSMNIDVDNVAGTAHTDIEITTSGVADHIMLAMFDALGDMLGDATNYVETSVKRRGKFPLTVNVSRYQRPTPHELRRQAETERDEWRQELIAAADALSPSQSEQVGGRGVAAVAQNVRSELDEALAAVRRVEAWARDLAARPLTTAVDIAAAEVGREALRRLRGEA